jgi:hypothetical protein
VATLGSIATEFVALFQPGRAEEAGPTEDIPVTRTLAVIDAGRMV